MAQTTKIVAHLEKEIELSGLENDGELTIPTMAAVTPNDNQKNTEQTEIACYYCKKNQALLSEIFVKG